MSATLLEATHLMAQPCPTGLQTLLGDFTSSRCLAPKRKWGSGSQAHQSTPTLSPVGLEQQV